MSIEQNDRLYLAANNTATQRILSMTSI